MSMSPHDIKRVHAGVPAGGEFAAHDRAEADLGLLDATACADCNSGTTDEPTPNGLCMPCADDDWQRCRDCGVVEPVDGEGYEGRCGNCADQHASLSCEECGEPMRIDDNGVSNHVDYDERIDWEADRDHVARAERDEHEAANDRDADISLALAGTGLGRDDILDTKPYVGGTLIRLKAPHRAGGYDAISVTGALGERRMVRYTRAGALHNAAGFAMVDEDGSSHELSCSAWIDGLHQPEPDEDGWSNFSREGTVNTWTSSGSRRVVHDTDPATGHMTWYNDAGIHRDGAPALFEAGKEPRWFQSGTEIPNPTPKSQVWADGALVGGDFVANEAITDTQARLTDHLARATRAKLIRPVKVTRRKDTVTVTAVPEDHEYVARILDSYNSVTFTDPQNPERAVDVKVTAA